MKNEKLVLRNKVTGKIASRRDQESKALTLHAQQLTASGQGGGIFALMLPTSVKDKNEMVRIGETYSVSRVKSRPGNNAETSDKKQLQAAMTNDKLIAKLAELYRKHIGEKPGPHTISSKAFTGWFKKELKNTKSIAYKTALKLAPVLLEVERNNRWWEAAFAERRKNAELRTFALGETIVEAPLRSSTTCLQIPRNQTSSTLKGLPPIR